MFASDYTTLMIEQNSVRNFKHLKAFFQFDGYPTALQGLFICKKNQVFSGQSPNNLFEKYKTIIQLRNEQMKVVLDQSTPGQFISHGFNLTTFLVSVIDHRSA